MTSIRGGMVHKFEEGIRKFRLKPYYEIVAKIKKMNAASWSDDELLARSRRMAREAGSGTPLDYLLAEAFAAVCEASRKALGLTLYDVQIVAGIALFEGKLIEMQTGEGKTLAAVLPAYLNALTGKGVHVLTFNDYLAKRDAEWMAPVYGLLGITVDYVTEHKAASDRKAAYCADVTYVTAKEAGFDYLRDSIRMDTAALCHREFHIAIVDEADSILIDEARIPLVIAGESSNYRSGAEQVAAIAKQLEYGIDYEADEHKRNVFLTESGADRAEALLNCGNLYDPDNAALLSLLHNALHAETLLKRNIDYIVRGGKVELVDGFTGRIAGNRHWPDGLQAAVEAKEGVAIGPGGRLLGTITLQHYLKLYSKLCGMTATAKTSAGLFRDTYGLDVVVIPPNKPGRRIDHPDVIFTHAEAKYKALIADLHTVHQTGRPILIGTASIEQSDKLAGDLAKAGITCSVLNARNDEMEAERIANAGKLGAVTVSTNMAGRGVDIRLGGGDEAEGAAVAALGGLYVVGTELHESVRIDNQLRGRAGRQGDPGSTRFYVSLEDDLLQRFNLYDALPESYRSYRTSEPIGDAAVPKTIAHIRRVIDGQHNEIRKTLHKYSDMLEQQRRIVHDWRYRVLTSQEELQLLSSIEPILYGTVVREVGHAAARQAEKQLTLHHIDLCWSDFLEYVASVKEGIHLASIGKMNPLDEYHKMIIPVFDSLKDKITDDITASFRKLWKSVIAGGLPIGEEGINRPSATWTYTVNDQFFQNRSSLL
ncbi:accessory Sec system translocase SecA2 [Paenibacillus sp. GCM10012303]|uniref:accessory Sec system translocase SecA2 n=1 Tax=Paenibacillus sp. GCM10012303 TaxID=3317340 RepID=UPI00360F250A